MAQRIFDPNLTPSLANLDLNFTELYDLRERIGTPSYTGSTPKLVLDASNSWTIGQVGGAVDPKIILNVNGVGVCAAGVNNSGSTNSLGAPTGVNYFGSLLLPLVFTAGGVERYRVDNSTGAVIVGSAVTSPLVNGVILYPAGAITIGNNAQATGYTFQNFLRSNTQIGSITQSGTTAVLYNTSSDRRLKKNIADAADCGDIIDAIKVREFDWIPDGNDHVTHGFIAQELAQVAPQAVKTGDDGEVISDTWAVDPSKLVALLVREVQSLRARVAALEA